MRSTLGLILVKRSAGMSALGQKRTCAVQNVMSALPPKADMCGATRDVRFVPKADIAIGPGDVRSSPESGHHQPTITIQLERTLCGWRLRR